MGRTIIYKQRYIIRIDREGLVPLYVTYYSGSTDEKYCTSVDLSLSKDFLDIPETCEFINKYDLPVYYEMTLCLYEFVSGIPISKKDEIPFKTLHRRMKVEKIISKMK